MRKRENVCVCERERERISRSLTLEAGFLAGDSAGRFCEKKINNLHRGQKIVL